MSRAGGVSQPQAGLQWSLRGSVSRLSGLKTSLSLASPDVLTGDLCLWKLWWPRLEPELRTRWRRCFQGPLPQELQRLWEAQLFGKRYVGQGEEAQMFRRACPRLPP